MFVDLDEESSTNLPDYIPVELEYEAQYFKFSVKGLIDSIFNVTLEETQSRLQAFKKQFLAEMKGQISEKELDKRMQLIAGFVQQDIYENFMKLEVFATRKVFRIPANICLPEDVVHEQEKDLTTAEENERKTKITSLERRAATLCYMRAKLKAELETIEKVQTVVRGTVESLSVLLENLPKLMAQNRERQNSLERVRELSKGNADMSQNNA